MPTKTPEPQPAPIETDPGDELGNDTSTPLPPAPATGKDGD